VETVLVAGVDSSGSTTVEAWPVAIMRDFTSARFWAKSWLALGTTK